MGRCKKQSKNKYSEHQLFSALQAVKNGSSQFAAAKKFGIPRSTLHNKVTGRTLMGKKPGPSTILSPEEECIIERWVFGLAVRGFPVTKRQLLRSVQLYLNINKRKTAFKNNLPGRKWYSAYRERHPLISEKISQNLTVRRAAVTAENIRSWHAEILQYCEEHDLINVLRDPARIFNMDEKGFVLTPNKEVVLVKRGDKAVYNRSKNDEKEIVTALLGGSAAGKMTPPMMVHSYKRMPAAVLLNNPPKWSVGISDSGWQTQQTFHDYIVNIFHKWLLDEKITLPVILFIDGHKSHVSLTLSDFCAANQIELVALYPNSTHLTQPMDVSVFKPLSNSWQNQAKDWRLENQFAKIEKKDVAVILKKAIDGTKYKEHLISGFEKCGLYPFNAENIDLSRMLPTVASSAKGQEDLWKFNQGPESVPNVAKESPLEAKKSAVDRLAHFECMLGHSVLNSFRSSANVWVGAKEYSILFTMWKQMYKEASETLSTESADPVILDVENIDDYDSTELMLVDIDEGTLLQEAIDSSIIVDVDSSSFINLSVPSLSSEANIYVEMPNVADEQLDNVSLDDVYEIEYNEAAVAHDVVPKVDASRNTVEMPNVADEIEFDETAVVHVHEMVPKVDASRNTNEQYSGKEGPENIIQQSDHCEIDETNKDFNQTSFKKAFFWPIDEKKQSKKRSVPKISSVMSSEAWREHERMKFEEKRKQETAKEARKAAREAKKLQSLKMAAEKLVAKNRKIEEAQKAAQIKSSVSRAGKETQKRKRSSATKKL